MTSLSWLPQWNSKYGEGLFLVKHACYSVGKGEGQDSLREACICFNMHMIKLLSDLTQTPKLSKPKTPSNNLNKLKLLRMTAEQVVSTNQNEQPK